MKLTKISISIISLALLIFYGVAQLEANETRKISESKCSGGSIGKFLAHFYQARV